MSPADPPKPPKPPFPPSPDDPQGRPASDPRLPRIPRTSSTRASRIPQIQPPPPPRPANPADVDDEVLDLTDVGSAGDDERLRAIQDVVAHAKRIDIEVARARPMESWRARPIVLATLASLLFVFTAWSYGARPDWLFGPDPSRVAAERRLAHLRFAMTLAARRIGAHQESTGGQLPASLAEVGEGWPGITYRVAQDSALNLSFELRADSLRYHSADDLAAFAAPAGAHLREPRR